MPADAVRKPRETVADPEFGPWLAQASILVIDDEPGMRNFLMRTLGPRCKRLEEAADAEEASRKLDEHHFDVVILDNIMPGKNGVDWLAEQRGIGFFADAILMTAYADLETAIRALRAGAADFILKPFRSNQLLNAVARCLDRVRLQRENYVLRYELKSTSDHILLRDKLIGESAAIARVRQTIARVAPLPTSVLLTGQSGTGKEVAARSLHSLSDRADKPFVPVNCAAIPPDMIESELFGHLKGAFTSAEGAREGLFMHAQGGTLFLDEIGELPPLTQSKLLRVLEDRRVRPLGSEREIPVDLRFVFATNADLKAEVEKGRFRADLFFRINVMQINLPPLKERGDDVQELTALFMRKLSSQLGMPPVPIDPEVRAALARYGWPGNVRELRNLVERTLILGRFPEEFTEEPGEETVGSEGSLAEIERQHILAVLRETAGDRDKAAKRLGISRKTIDRKFAAWNV
ncbi:DNA-binding transcriptional response regulator, NtrC family, contains REC, AAA-type ATPase, and a Fis-type DNA-binding domains [Mesorhizobium albiziae]|uniref:DNA-binding transcriptional response regulator, NtrC family, contains REC, AAA-type ATPase, and a Fis-type DNA-binding domains n=1 Tax=Neomesorhizobium albiziae TaxID=335020 RepID=A0A1I3WJW3_9HYPH|nr:sigma-54 dependent transcriptional regulator [Mesorhizobium albiziae]GLS31648.1 sigma-54-dependent Fis family transcriptional regulator [Mesorhizobium albiziae]SFK07147.1 DNA-binding transcriptional response regulator, NtrC family, contains REC, AAA-type ATPase, and a Fis-type DNA-binding domains [Mesorhizobium albiziae]